MKYLVIINPCAGRGKSLKMLPRLRNWLSRCPHDFTFTMTPSPDEMRDAIADAAARQFDGVLLAGGDGTIHEALDTLSRSSLVCGILPCGRGNDFARNIGIPNDLKSNCIVARYPAVSTIDLPSVNGIPFASVACIGFDADVNPLPRVKKGFFGG